VTVVYSHTNPHVDVYYRTYSYVLQESYILQMVLMIW